MEDIRKRSGTEMPLNPKLKRPAGANGPPSSATMSSTIIPLATEAWKKPLVSHGGASTSGTKPYTMSLDIVGVGQGIKVKDGEKKQIQTLSSPSENRFSSGRTFGSSARNAACFRLEQAIEHELKYGRKLDPNMDPKKLRRTISNRLSAKRSRMKKANHINDMEKLIRELEATIAVVTPQIQYHQQQKTLLAMENKLLQQTLDTCTMKSNLTALQIEEKKAEVERLKELLRVQLEQRQQLELMEEQEEISGIEMNPDQFLNLSAVNLDNDNDNISI